MLLERAIASRGPWRVSDVLLAESILACTEKPASLWVCRLAAMCPTSNTEAMDAARQALRRGTAPAHYEFVSSCDTWQLWLCGAGKRWTLVRPPQVVAAELVDASDMWDADRALASEAIDGWPPVDASIEERVIDLRDMGLV